MNALPIYIGILFFVFLTSLCLNERPNNRGALTCSFLVLWFFYALSTTGTDYISYINYYEMFSWSDLLKTEQEVGYVILNCIIKIFVYDAAYGVMIIKTIVILNVYIALYRMRDKIQLGTSLFMWVCLQYFNGYLIAMALASSLVLIGMSYMVENKIWKAMIVFFLAATLHYSALIVVLFSIVYIILMQNELSGIKMFLYNVALIVVTVRITQFLPMVVNSIDVLSKYSIYIRNVDDRIGIMQVVFYLPLWVTAYSLVRDEADFKFKKLFNVLLWYGFAVAVMAYKYTIFMRMSTYFIACFVFFVPYVLKLLNEKSPQLRKGCYVVRGMTGIYFMYGIARACLFLYEHWTISYLGSFSFIWQ